MLVVRGTGASVGGLTLEFPGSNGAAERMEAPAPANATDVSELKVEVRKSGTVTVLAAASRCSAGRSRSSPTIPPRSRSPRTPEKSPRGGLKLFYKVEDDYGVVSAETRIRRVRPKEDRTSTAWARAERQEGAAAARTSVRPHWRCACRAPIPSRPRDRASTRSATTSGPA